MPFDFLMVPLADKKMIPIENYGVKCMSMGSLVADGEAIVWRGPMASVDIFLRNMFSQFRH